MSREIKFRGYSETYQKWYYGYYLKNQSDSSFIRSIDDFDTYWVLEETVGQFTGLCDKNGAEIYEKDILELYDDTLNFERTYMIIVRYIRPQAMFNIDLHSFATIRVIGNIHDNPEFLEESNEPSPN
jgi:hypothetical protein